MAKSDIKKKLLKKVWEKEDYYNLAHRGSLNLSHPGMVLLKKLVGNSKQTLDMGCGEGTRLDLLVNKKHEGFGIDISKTAIGVANKKYPRLNFKKADLEKIPYKDGYFDMVYCAFVLEHLSEPEKVIDEAVRVTQKEGKIVFIAPNYGAPNRASPPNIDSRWGKFIKGFINDWLRIIKRNNNLSWNRVTPLADSNKYDMDWDVVVEPYLGSLGFYLNKRGLEIVRADSCWSEELPGSKFHQKIFRKLAYARIYPFKIWGPHLLIYAIKTG